MNKNTKAATVATGAAFENQSAGQRIEFSRASLAQPLQTQSQKITSCQISTAPTRCCPLCSSESREVRGWIVEAGMVRMIPLCVSCARTCRCGTAGKRHQIAAAAVRRLSEEEVPIGY